VPGRGGKLVLESDKIGVEVDNRLAMSGLFKGVEMESVTLLGKTRTRTKVESGRGWVWIFLVLFSVAHANEIDFPSVEIGFYTSASANRRISGEYDRSLPIYLRIELVGGQIPVAAPSDAPEQESQPTAELVWQLFDEAGESVIAPQSVSWSPSQRSIMVPVALPEKHLLPPGSYRLHVLLTRTDGLARSWSEDWFILQPTVAELNQKLLLAAYEGDIKRIQDALRRGASVDSASSDALTPLHLAALARQPRAMELLLQRGAYIRAKDWQGKTAGFYYYWATGGEREQAARFGYSPSTLENAADARSALALAREKAAQWVRSR
jgi:hypothetical protein